MEQTPVYTSELCSLAIKKEEKLMPNGDDKNWIRLCVTINGFRVKYGMWPERVRMSSFMLENLRHLFHPSTFSVLQSQLPIEKTTEESIEVFDREGRQFTYGDLTDGDLDISSLEWLGISPDAASEAPQLDSGLSAPVKIGEYTDRVTMESATMEGIVFASGLCFSIDSPSASATSEVIPWKSIANYALQYNPDMFGDLDVPLHNEFRIVLENLGFRL